MNKITNDEYFTLIGKIKEEIINELKNLKDPEFGFFNSIIHDPTNRFIFNKTSAEKVLEGQDNTYIVFGRDRLGSEKSGYGSKGHLKAGAIDIVAGRMSAMNAEEIKDDLINTNVIADAARIYISQKTDIDANFFLPEGLTKQSKARSAVAIKADDVRLIARESLKIITKTDDKNSNNTIPYGNVGVQLIAGGKSDEMQPMVKGQYLTDGLLDFANKLVELHALLSEFVEIQDAFNIQIAKHTHFTTFNGTPTSGSPHTLPKGKEALVQTYLKVKQGLASSAWNIQKWQTDYLTVIGEKYINSKYHHLN